MQNRKTVSKELEKIYDNHFKHLRNKFSQSLKNNPLLNLILKLLIIANTGIWLAVALLIVQNL
ncbi:MAG: hypothetical protein A2887_03350 [Alphaproteobacteria bacterium RIFCSPLOWO2_01_FULL_40_26]|nr:MAG: hypothetical protein A2887_03350 [Alphaproteobacteria bacterium RIFCSPLOWO2_01_FULL_40_26]OFX10232.1 MAG: hypothetical protein A3H30_04275 [Alphaproteobacteria bacterium RIFCSPLOWO2_02_FULL_40_19]